MCLLEKGRKNSRLNSAHWSELGSDRVYGEVVQLGVRRENEEGTGKNDHGGAGK